LLPPPEKYQKKVIAARKNFTINKYYENSKKNRKKEMSKNYLMDYSLEV